MANRLTTLQKAYTLMTLIYVGERRMYWMNDVSICQGSNAMSDA